MEFKIEGLDKLQRDLEQVSKALSALDGHIATVQFNPLDPSSVEVALAQVESAIDEKIAPFHGNKIIENLASQMKQKYHNQVLDRVSSARIEERDKRMSHEPLLSVLSQIEDTVADLRSANYQTFDRHVKKLSRLLHSDCVSQFADRLQVNVNIDEFLAEGQASEGSMAGSAILQWPEKIQDELGLVISLIDQFSNDSREALNFSHTFYTNGSDITANLRNMVGQMIVPFSRDYINYIKRESGLDMSEKKTLSAMTYTQQFNFNNSSVGAVQTGDHSIANIAIQNTTQATETLLKALTVVAEELSRIDAVPGHNKDEILELVEDGKVELAKTKPNVTKLTSYLGMIGGTLGAAANLKPAYDMLKAAASSFGIQLP